MYSSSSPGMIGPSSHTGTFLERKMKREIETSLTDCQPESGRLLMRSSEATTNNSFQNMIDRFIIREVHKAMAEHGRPMYTEELFDHCSGFLGEFTTEHIEEVLKESDKFVADPNMRWNLTIKTKKDPDQEKYFPPDVEPLPDMHLFYRELADLVDEHAEEPEDRYRFLCACVSFGEYWKSDPGGW